LGNFYGIYMPHEITSMDEIDEKFLERTFVVYRKGLGDIIKYKFRTKSTLFTIKVDQENSSQLQSKIEGSAFPIEIIDV